MGPPASCQPRDHDPDQEGRCRRTGERHRRRPANGCRGDARPDDTGAALAHAPASKRMTMCSSTTPQTSPAFGDAGLAELRTRQAPPVPNPKVRIVSREDVPAYLRVGWLMPNSDPHNASASLIWLCECPPAVPGGAGLTVNATLPVGHDKVQRLTLHDRYPRKRRERPQRTFAQKILKDLFPGRIPSRQELSDTDLHWVMRQKGFCGSLETARRASGRRRK
jgi:hypothetical protein